MLMMMLATVDGISVNIFAAASPEGVYPHEVFFVLSRLSRLSISLL